MSIPARAVLATVLLLLAAGSGWGDDPPPGPGGGFPQGAEAPPELPKGEDPYLVPGETPSLHQWLGTLRAQLSRFETPPPSTSDATALRDAWTSILKPRIARMINRVKTWEDLTRWTTVGVGGEAAHLKPDQWATFTRDMAQLATEIHGAWKQYGSVEVRPKLRLEGYPLTAPGFRPVHLGYRWPDLYRGVLDRQSAAASLGYYDGLSYWHLLSRFRHAWDWSWQRRLLWYRYWENREQATEKLFEDIYAELDATRDALAQTLLGLQVFVGALQNAEEQRLKGACAACRASDATLREMAETAIRDMAIARLEGERFRGDSYAKYGTLLRSWMRRQKAAAWVLDIPDEPAEAPEAPR